MTSPVGWNGKAFTPEEIHRLRGNVDLQNAMHDPCSHALVTSLEAQRTSKDPADVAARGKARRERLEYLRELRSASGKAA